MMTRLPRIWLGALAVALLQTGALAAMILDRAHHVATGREIILPVVPVDPRSLFRGDYVILNYEISRASLSLLSGPAPRESERLYVVLGRRKNGGVETWSPIQLSRTWPSSVPAETVVLAGWAVGRPFTSVGGTQEVRIRYGIESYFVPEGEGKDLERRVRAGDMSVVVAVDGGGRGAIKGLVLDGEVRYDEPLF